MASAQYQQGENSDRGIEQSSYDDAGSYRAADESNQYNSDQGTTERSGDAPWRSVVATSAKLTVCETNRCVSGD